MIFSIVLLANFIQLAISASCFDQITQMFPRDPYTVLNGDILSLELSPLYNSEGQQVWLTTTDQIGGGMTMLDFVDSFNRSAWQSWSLVDCRQPVVDVNTYRVYLICDNTTLVTVAVDPVEHTVRLLADEQILDAGQFLCTKMAANPFTPNLLHVYCRNVTVSMPPLLVTYDLITGIIDRYYVNLNENDFSGQVSMNFHVQPDGGYLIIYAPSIEEGIEFIPSFVIMRYRFSTKKLENHYSYKLSNLKIKDLAWKPLNNTIKIRSLGVYRDKISLTTCSSSNCVLQLCSFDPDTLKLECSGLTTQKLVNDVRLGTNTTILFISGRERYESIQSSYMPLLSLLNGTDLYGSYLTSKSILFWSEEPIVSFKWPLTDIDSLKASNNYQYVISGIMQRSLNDKNQKKKVMIFVDHMYNVKYYFAKTPSRIDPALQTMTFFQLEKPLRQDFILEINSDSSRLVPINDYVIYWNTSYVYNRKSPTSTTLNIFCKPVLGETETLSIKVKVMPFVNSQASLGLPDLVRYVGSLSIPIATRSDNVYGNAMTFRLKSQSDKFELIQKLANQIPLNWRTRGASFTNMIGLDESTIAMWNETYLQLVLCFTRLRNNEFTCSKEPQLTIRITGKKILDMKLVNGLFVIALDVAVEPIAEAGNQRQLQLQVYSSKGVLQHDSFFNFLPRAVDFLMNSDYIIINTIGQESIDKPTGLYFAQFNPQRDKNLPSSLLLHFMFPAFLCPRSLIVDQRTRFTLLINCRCENSSKTTVVNFNLIVENIAGSVTDVPMYFDDPVELLCSTGKSMFVYQPGTLNLFIVPFNNNYARFSRIRLPVSDYNITELLYTSCDVRKKILIVLGRTADGSKKIIVFRTEGYDDATRRVHSVFDVSKESNRLLKVSSFAQERIVAVVLDEHMMPLESYVIEPNGPLLYLNGSSQSRSEPVLIDIVADLPGLIPRRIEAQQGIFFLSTTQYFSAEPRITGRKIKVIDGLTINLESILNVNGIYSKIATIQSQGFRVNDRISVVNRFENISDSEIWYSCYMDGLIMGNTLEFDGWIVKLTNTTSGEVLQSFKVINVMRIECIKHPESGNSMFYSLVQNQTGMNWINVFHKVTHTPNDIDSRKSASKSTKSASDGEAVEEKSIWIRSGINMNIDGYNYVEFAGLSKESVVMTAFSMKYGYSSIVRVLTIKGRQLLSSSEIQTQTRDVVTNFQAINFRNNILVITSEQTDIKLRLQVLRYIEDRNKLLQYGTVEVNLKGFMEGLISTRAFSCQISTLVSKRNITVECALFDQDSTGLMLEIYLEYTNYMIRPFVNSPLFDIVGSMESVPYTSPDRVETFEDYIFVYSSINKYQLDKDKMIVAIYRRPSQYYRINTTRELVPYKILTSQSIGLNNTFEMLDGNYFTDAYGAKLFYLGGESNVRLLFGLTGLTMEITDMNAITVESSIVLAYPRQCYGVSSNDLQTGNVTLYLHEMIDLNNSTKDLNGITHKKRLLLISVSGLILLVSLLGYLTLCSERRSKLRISDLINENNIEASIYPYDSVIEY